VTQTASKASLWFSKLCRKVFSNTSNSSQATIQWRFPVKKVIEIEKEEAAAMSSNDDEMSQVAPPLLRPWPLRQPTCLQAELSHRPQGLSTIIIASLSNIVLLTGTAINLYAIQEDGMMESQDGMMESQKTHYVFVFFPKGEPLDKTAFSTVWRGRKEWKRRSC
jgi:hypothetical protein